MLDRQSRKQMVFALTVIPEAYGDERGQMRAMLLKALAEFAKLHPGADRAVVVGMLGEVDPVEMEAAARAQVPAAKASNSLSAMVAALNELYASSTRSRAAA